MVEIEPNLAAAPGELGNFVALGDNAVPSSASRAIDGDLQTHATMGNTAGATNASE